MPKLTITRNVGRNDASKLGVELYKVGDVVNVNEKEAHTLTQVLHVAEPWSARSDVRAVPASATVRAVPDKATAESPVEDENARQAIDEISRMTSKDKLRAIEQSDERKTVKEAAAKRLKELG